MPTKSTGRAAVYGCDEAARSIAEATGEPLEVAALYVEARRDYDEGRGIVSRVELFTPRGSATAVDEVVAANTFNPEEISAHVQEATDISARRVARMILAEVNYMESIGLVTPLAVRTVRDWRRAA